MDFIFQFSFRLKYTTFFLRASLHGYILLKTNSYFSVLQTKYETKITSLRGVKKTLKRTSPTSAVKLPNFSAELWQLLWSSLGARRVAGFYACSPFGKTDAWCRKVSLGFMWRCGHQDGITTASFLLPSTLMVSGVSRRTWRTCSVSCTAGN